MRRGRLGRQVAAAGLALLLSLILSSCLQDPNEGGGQGLGGQAFADGGTSDGDGRVEILGVFGGGEQDGLEAALKPFEDRTGIDVVYTADQDFATLIKQRATTGTAPDIAFFPQPGGLLELAEDGYIQPVDTFLDYDAIDRSLVPGILDVARLNGRTYGAPFRLSIKSLVFYPKRPYTAAGYNEAPASLQELDRIAQEIRSSGTPPWCMGWESAQATGWVGTDWIEELVLRMWGPDVYDDWAYHRIPFNDDRIVKSFERFHEMALADGQTYGGTRSILNTPFTSSFNPAFENPAKCLLHRQGNFIVGELPKKVTSNLDEQLGMYVLPPDEEGYAGQPIMGAGDTAALFNGDDEEAIEVMRFLTSDEFGAEWAKLGGYLSPHRTFAVDNYTDAVLKKVATIVADADVFRFDASDLMPVAVGAGSFWTGMVDFAGGDSARKVTTAIEKSWPADE